MRYKSLADIDRTIERLSTSLLNCETDQGKLILTAKLQSLRTQRNNLINHAQQSAGKAAQK